MSEVTESAKIEGYFMPYHAVMKDSSETTKLKVVFDAFAKTYTGVSLNNCLKVGSKNQRDFFSVLVRFGTHQYVFTTDIEKMYRQILVDEQDTPYQQIIYRENQNQPLKIYHANTVTYGKASAPFLVVRSLFQLANDIQYKFPKVSEILKRDFYVDDGLAGSNNIKGALVLRDDSITVTNSVGFTLRQWASNEPKLVEGLPAEIANVNLCTKDETQGALGVQWLPCRDVLKYKVIIDNDSDGTKRKILSKIAKIYDPKGLIGPVIVSTKLAMQSLWQREVGWDESDPIAIYAKWINIESQLNVLHSIEFDRKMIIENAVQLEVYGFCDASEKAYGACINIRSVNNEGKIMTNLLCSKNSGLSIKNICCK